MAARRTPSLAANNLFNKALQAVVPKDINKDENASGDTSKSIGGGRLKAHGSYTVNERQDGKVVDLKKLQLYPHTVRSRKIDEDSTRNQPPLSGKTPRSKKETSKNKRTPKNSSGKRHSAQNAGSAKEKSSEKFLTPEMIHESPIEQKLASSLNKESLSPVMTRESVIWQKRRNGRGRGRSTRNRADDGNSVIVPSANNICSVNSENSDQSISKSTSNRTTTAGKTENPNTKSNKMEVYGEHSILDNTSLSAGRSVETKEENFITDDSAVSLELFPRANDSHGENPVSDAGTTISVTPSKEPVETKEDNIIADSTVLSLELFPSAHGENPVSDAGTTISVTPSKEPGETKEENFITDSRVLSIEHLPRADGAHGENLVSKSSTTASVTSSKEFVDTMEAKFVSVGQDNAISHEYMLPVSLRRDVLPNLVQTPINELQAMNMLPVAPKIYSRTCSSPGDTPKNTPLNTVMSPPYISSETNINSYSPENFGKQPVSKTMIYKRKESVLSTRKVYTRTYSSPGDKFRNTRFSQEQQHQQLLNAVLSPLGETPKTNSESLSSFRFASKADSFLELQDTTCKRFFDDYCCYSQPFVDSHCHLDLLLWERHKWQNSFASFKSKMNKSFPPNFKGCITNFAHPKHFDKEIDFQKVMSLINEEGIFASIGCHPKCCALGAWTDKLDFTIRSIITHGRENVVAIGECGLDYSQTAFSQAREKQKEAFITQMKLATELQLPLVIHSRDSDADCLQIMQENLHHDHPIHRHCFTGSSAEMKKWHYAFPNMCFGFTPLVLTSRMLTETIRDVPIDKLLLETDSPYFLPYQAKYLPGMNSANHPGMAITAGKHIAINRTMDIDSLLFSTLQNTCKLYRVNFHSGEPL